MSTPLTDQARRDQRDEPDGDCVSARDMERLELRYNMMREIADEAMCALETAGDGLKAKWRELDQRRGKA